MSSSAAKVISATWLINGNPLYYERRGTGEHFVLLIPGALGTTSLNFSKQHSNFDLSEFTLISVDPVGYGKSRPAVRPTERHYWVDAENYHLLMKDLNISQYSIIGFSDGGRVALIMGARYPEEIKKIVACGSSCYITEDEKKALNAVRLVGNWGTAAREDMEEVYGTDLQFLWNQFLDAYFTYTDIFKEDVPKIQCPVFILHGEDDSIVFVEHAYYFQKHLRNAKLYVHKQGSHYFHLMPASYSIFNKIVQEFLLT